MNREISSTDRAVDRLGRSSALDGIAGLIQPPMRAWLDGTGGRAWLKDALHGTTLRHPLHPALTDLPIGAWTMAAIFDALELAGSARFTDASDLAVGAGVLGGLAASATGWAEWSDTNGEPRRLGLVHALLNGVAETLYAASWIARRRGARGAGLATAFAGYGLVSLSAYLGGELAFGLGIGTKHTVVPKMPPDEFRDVLPETGLSFETKRVELDGIPVLLTRDRDGVHAVAAICTHRGAALEEGTADGCVTCPWHGARFSLESGAVFEGPAVFPLATFEVRIVDGNIQLRARVDNGRATGVSSELPALRRRRAR